MEKQNEKHNAKTDVTGTFKISPKDIEFGLHGFQCKKITELTDEQLGELEDKLSEIRVGVKWANIEEMNFLCVTYSKYILYLDEKQKLAVCEILNCL